MLHAVLCAVSHHPQPSLATQVATNVTTSVEHDDVSSWQSDELEALLAKESPVHKPETEINNSSATTGATAATTPTKKKKKRHHKSIKETTQEEGITTWLSGAIIYDKTEQAQEASQKQATTNIKLFVVHESAWHIKTFGL